MELVRWRAEEEKRRGRVMSRRECGVGDMTLLEEPARSKEVLKREEEGGKLLRTVSDVGTLFGRFDIDISHDLYAHTRTHRHTQT